MSFRGENGKAITYTNNTGAVIAVNAVVEGGETVMVAKTAIAIGGIGSLWIDGIHEFVAEGDTAWVPGDVVYWNPYLGEATKEASSFNKIGFVTEIKAVAARIGYVSLEQEPGA